MQRLSEQLLFEGDAVDKRGHGGGGDEGVEELLQLDSDLGLLQHDDDDEQLGLSQCQGRRMTKHCVHGRLVQSEDIFFHFVRFVLLAAASAAQLD